jgi:hypothetical protein
MLLETKPGITSYADISNPVLLVKKFLEYKTRVSFYYTTHIRVLQNSSQERMYLFT